jgi:hypothetical protein
LASATQLFCNRSFVSKGTYKPGKRFIFSILFNFPGERERTLMFLPRTYPPPHRLGKKIKRL